MPGKNLAPTRDCDAESPIRAAASDAGDAALRSAAPQRSAVGARLAEAEKGELRGLGSSWTPIPTWTCNERFDLGLLQQLGTSQTRLCSLAPHVELPLQIPETRGHLAVGACAVAATSENVSTTTKTHTCELYRDGALRGCPPKHAKLHLSTAV